MHIYIYAKGIYRFKFLCLKKTQRNEKNHEVYAVHLVKAFSSLDHFETEEPKRDTGSYWRRIENLHPPRTQAEPGTTQLMLVGASSLHPGTLFRDCTRACPNFQKACPVIILEYG